MKIPETVPLRRRSAAAGVNRRHFLLAAAAAAITSTCGVAQGEEPSLGATAASKGLLYGSLIRYANPSIRSAYVTTDPAYARLAARECRLFVSGTMFWKLVQPRPGPINLSAVDPAVRWAESHGMAFRGTPLVWHHQTPAWFSALPDRATAIRALQERVRVTCGHFAGRVQSWDVVNEVIVTKGGENGLRRSVFLSKIGPDYLDIAFRTAREADPKALLTINETSIEYASANHRARRRALLAVIDGLQHRKVPIDAVGIQSHLATEYAKHFDEASFAEFLKEISARGLKIMVTEMDVIDRGAPSEIEARDAEVASLYKRYLDVALDNPALVALITWGLSDRESWITRGDDPSFRRSDGLEPRPLPFDDNYRPKPACRAIVEALDAAPRR